MNVEPKSPNSWHNCSSVMVAAINSGLFSCLQTKLQPWLFCIIIWKLSADYAWGSLHGAGVKMTAPGDFIRLENLYPEGSWCSCTGSELCFWTAVMLEAVTLPLSRDPWASKGEKDFYSPFSQLRNPSRGKKKTMRLFSSQTGRNFCLYYFNTCEQPSQGEWLSAGGISLYHNNYHESVGSVMFSALLLRSAIEMMTQLFY